MLKNSVKINISAHDFRRLVRGESLTIHSGDRPAIEIILSDIGFKLMRDAISEAQLIKEGKDLGIVLT
jgi:hypothetical protein